MMRSEGGRRTGEEETMVVERERRIMERGSTERGALLGSELGGWVVGSTVGSSAMVLVRRSEEWMGRNWYWETARGRRL